MKNSHQNNSPTSIHITLMKFGFGSLTILVLFFALGLYKYFEISNAMAEGAKKGPPITGVSTIIAKKAPWMSVFRTAGTIRGEQSATLSSEAAGRVAKINVSEGQKVEAGTVLLELDNVVEEAEYNAGIAQRDLADKEFNRYKQLLTAKAISQDEFDKSRLTYESLKSAADALKGRLERRKIVAPFNATVGVIRVNLGDYLKEGIEIVAIENNENLYVIFNLNQKTLLSIQNAQNKKLDVIVKAVGIDAPIFTTLDSVDPSINDFTKTALGKAKIPNELKNTIVAGMSVGVEIQLHESKNIIAIPSSSISFAPFGDSVYIVETAAKEGESEATSSVKQAFVKILESRGELTAIANGLEEGQQVVSSGTFKLFPGAPVIVNNDMKPGDNLRPNPPNS